MRRVVTAFMSLVILSMASLPWAQTHQKPNETMAPSHYKNPQFLITTAALWERLEHPQLRIIDVRPAEAYAKGHIPAAVNLPLSRITATRNGIPGMLASQETVEASLGSIGVSNDSQVVIYDVAGGDHATRLFWVLDYYGHQHVAVLDGGLAAWRAAALPFTTAVPQIRKAVYRGTPDPSKLATGGWIQERLTDPEVLLIDARSRAEFRGKIAGRGVTTAGHIPGAVNIAWQRNLTKTSPHRILPPVALRRLYEEVGGSRDKTLVTYCRSGMRASHTYFVLRLLGYPRVRLYDGSWLEWANSGQLPLQHQCSLDPSRYQRRG